MVLSYDSNAVQIQFCWSQISLIFRNSFLWYKREQSSPTNDNSTKKTTQSSLFPCGKISYENYSLSYQYIAHRFIRFIFLTFHITAGLLYFQDHNRSLITFFMNQKRRFNLISGMSIMNFCEWLNAHVVNSALNWFPEINLNEVSLIRKFTIHHLSLFSS